MYFEDSITKRSKQSVKFFKITITYFILKRSATDLKVADGDRNLEIN